MRISATKVQAATPLMLLLAAACTVMPVYGQFYDGGDGRAELNVTAGVPQGELERHLDRAAIGFSGFVGGPVPGTPIVLGSEIGFMNYGADARLRVHETVFDEGVGSEFAVPVEAVHTNISNNILMGHLVLRLEPLEGMFRPYVDGLAGVKYFAARLGVESDVVVFRRGLSQDATVTDYAFSYGVGGGIELMLYEHASHWRTETADVSLHVGVRYLFGTRASYVAESSVHEVDGELIAQRVSSRTDLIVPQLGLRIRH